LVDFWGSVGEALGRAVSSFGLQMSPEPRLLLNACSLQHTMPPIVPWVMTLSTDSLQDSSVFGLDGLCHGGQQSPKL
jgi:hypothetical protein